MTTHISPVDTQSVSVEGTPPITHERRETHEVKVVTQGCAASAQVLRDLKDIAQVPLCERT